MMNELLLSTCGGCFCRVRSLVESFPSELPYSITFLHVACKKSGSCT